MMAAPARLLGLSSREQVRSTYSYLGMMVVQSPLLGLAFKGAGKERIRARM
jgi:hypothetical protein